MRPVRLEVVGFSGFRQPTEIDFADVDLAAFVGPTGSGKSSIIDAITFALYGNVPRLGDDRKVAPVIHQLCPEARVLLDFEVDDRPYQAIRVVRRSRGGATTKEARLEQGDAVLAGNARELTAAVESLLGLSFEQFTKTVVLPQGKFADFLHDKPANRQQLLRRLLDLEVYSRMASAANLRSRDAETRLDVLSDQLDRSADLHPDELGRLQRRATDLDAARTVAKELHERHRDLLDRMRRADAEAEQVDRALGALARVEQPPGVADLDEEIAATERQRSEHEAAAATAQAQLGDAQAAAEAGPDAAECRRLLDTHQLAATLEGELPPLAEQARADRDRAKAAAAALAQARTAEDDARAALDRAKEQAGLAGVIAALRVGEACPVCRQQVDQLPDHDPDAELSAARSAHRTARRHLATAEEEHQAATGALARSAATLQAKEEERDRQRAQLADAPAPPEVEEQLRRAEELAAAVKAAATSARAAGDRLAAATREVEARREEERTARSRLGRARDGVAALAPPEPGGERLLDDWRALVDWAAAKGAELRTERSGLGERIDALSTEKGRLATTAIDLCAPFEMDPALDGLPERLAVAAERALAAVDRYSERLGERAQLQSQVADLQDRHEVARELGRLLSANHFERWLLSEALADLGERASERLHELSGGQYSLMADDERFSVRDHRNGDEVRDVRTLSGGETFLASLSLALALADGIRDLASAAGPRLESVFLDEGFGTLDPEALDVVAAAIEELGAGGRMVGIVTHIRELADRMPVRYEVHKDTDGSHVERVEV